MNGTLGMIVPGQGGVDDSDYIIVRSPGVVADTVLTFTPNVSGSARTDVVECRVIQVVVLNTTRDIFDPVTETFTPTLVDKVIEHQLEFRIDPGTGGAGLRVPDPEWCPLAIVFVQDAAAGFSTSEVYDVRPLVDLRAPGGGGSPRQPIPGGVIQDEGLRPQYRQMTLGNDGASDSEVSFQGGFFEVEWGGFIVGGMLRQNGVSTTGNFLSEEALHVELGDVANQLTSAPTTGLGLQHFALCAYFPGGYSNWTRYSQNAVVADASQNIAITGRIPTGPSGILLLTPENQVNGNGITNAQSSFAPQYGGLANVFGIFVCQVMIGSDDVLRSTLGSLNAGFFMGVISAANSDQGGTPFAAAVTISVATTRMEISLTQVPFQSLGIPGPATAVLMAGESSITTNLAGDTLDSITPISKWRNIFAADLGIAGAGGLQVQATGQTAYLLNIREWFPLVQGRQWDASIAFNGIVVLLEHSANAVATANMNLGLVGYKLG